MPENLLIPSFLSENEKEKFKVLGGNSNPDLVKKICHELGVEPIKAIVGSFSDKETQIQIEEDVRGSHTFVIQSACTPANQNIMELLIMIDSVRRASADKVTVVLPYYGYARQDRKPHPRTPVSARLVADLISAAGADKLIILDLHAGQIQGFFDNRHNPDHIYIRPIFLNDIRKCFPDPSSCIIVSPDAGGVARAISYAKRLGCPIAQIDKRREGPNQAEVANIVMSESRENAIIVDDIVDTGGTLKIGAVGLLEKGIKKVWAYCTHPVLSGNAIQNITESPIEKLVVSNSIPLSPQAADCRKIRVLGVEKLLAFTMLNVFREKSVSGMLEAFENFI